MSQLRELLKAHDALRMLQQTQSPEDGVPRLVRVRLVLVTMPKELVLPGNQLYEQYKTVHS